MTAPPAAAPGRTPIAELGHPEALLLRPEEVADRLRLSRSKVYELMAAGQLQALTIGRSRRVRMRDLVTFIQAQQV